MGGAGAREFAVKFWRLGIIEACWARLVHAPRAFASLGGNMRVQSMPRLPLVHSTLDFGFFGDLAWRGLRGLASPGDGLPIPPGCAAAGARACRAQEW